MRTRPTGTAARRALRKEQSAWRRAELGGQKATIHFES